MRILEKFFEECGIFTLAFGDPAVFDMNGERRCFEIAILRAEIVADNAVDHIHAIDSLRTRQHFTAWQIAPFLPRNDAAGLQPFQLFRKACLDVRTGCRLRNDLLCFFRERPNFDADFIDCAKIGLHAFEHDLR